MAIEIEPERRTSEARRSRHPSMRASRTRTVEHKTASTPTAAAAPPSRPPEPRRAGPRTPDGSRALSAGSVVIVGVILYVVAGLLNAGSLLRKAETQVEDAPLKGLSEMVARPLAAVAGWLALDRPSAAIADIRGIETDDSTRFEDLATTPPATGEVAPLTTAAPTVEASAAGATATTVPPITIVAPTSTLPPGQPVLRVPTEDNPLRVYAAGDSLVGGWGQALESLADDSSGLDVELDYEVSTGLVRTDYYNWPGRLKDQIEQRDPEVVVLGFGGNDTQPMRIDGRSVPVSDPAWQEEYRRRVGAVMDYVNAGGRKLIWVGTPNHPDPARSAELAVIDQIARAEAAARPNITFVDTWKRFASPDGGYAAYIADARGEYREVRAPEDGFHLNLDGITILGNDVLTEIEKAIAQYSS